MARGAISCLECRAQSAKLERRKKAKKGSLPPKYFVRHFSINRREHFRSELNQVPKDQEQDRKQTTSLHSVSMAIVDIVIDECLKLCQPTVSLTVCPWWGYNSFHALYVLGGGTMASTLSLAPHCLQPLACSFHTLIS